MKTRTLLLSVALVVAAGAALAQPKPSLIPPPSPPIPSPPLPYVPPVPAEKTVDELLTELERVQADKAALEKREQDLKASVRKKLDAQNERLKKLGLAPPAPAKDKEPDRVGRIIIEGNQRTSEKTILELLELQPGQILLYPALEPARARLEKYGLLAVRVEVVPGTDAQYKDVRVKVIEPPEASKP